MNKQQIIDFIKESLSKGNSRAEIERILLINQVEAQALKEAFDSLEPTNKPPEPSPEKIKIEAPLIPTDIENIDNYSPALPKKSHTGLIVTTIILVLLLIVGGASAYFYLTSQPPTPDPIPTPLELEPEETTEFNPSETADWQTYRNEEYGFEFKYPADWRDCEKEKNKIGQHIMADSVACFFDPLVIGHSDLDPSLGGFITVTVSPQPDLFSQYPNISSLRNYFRNLPVYNYDGELSPSITPSEGQTINGDKYLMPSLGLSEFGYRIRYYFVTTNNVLKVSLSTPDPTQEQYDSVYKDKLARAQKIISTFRFTTPNSETAESN